MSRWDIFCTVVDNYGDIGTCWRLAQQLTHEHAADVRLWVDQLPSLAQLVPGTSASAEQQHVGRIEIRRWCADFPEVEAADVVIEAFGCELPESYIAAMVRRSVAPAWINLEYLSAEDWVEGCHRLPSLRTKWPLTKCFFFPGFTPQTGGLLRERNLLADRAAFDAAAEAEFWASLGVPARSEPVLNSVSTRTVPAVRGTVPFSLTRKSGQSPRSEHELRVSLFCYQNAALPDLLQCWAEGPDAVTVLATPGPATEQVAGWFGESLVPGTPLRRSSLTVYGLPLLPQASFDRLLWACDVNFVRGEDSFVRAQWAGRPLVWQIYPQTEDAHQVKLEAFLARYLDGCEKSAVVRRCWQAWNGSGNIATAWPDFVAQRAAVEQHGKVWVNRLDQMGDLADNLACFARRIQDAHPPEV